MDRIVWAPVILAVAGLLTLTACAQQDPFALQRSAIQRIDGFVEHFRRTGDMWTRRPDLERAATELDVSNRMLEARQDWTPLAIGLIKRGSIYRIQGQWPQAIALYQKAEEAAKRDDNVVQQADASAWRALAESSRRNLGQAFTDAVQAVRLAEATNDKDVLARALDVLGITQTDQGDLAGAADTLNREVVVAAEAKDPTAAYFAYLNRSDVYLKVGQRCDFQRSFEPCYQALDRARADLEQALAIGHKLGFPGLVRQAEGFLSDVETRRNLVKSQEATHQSLQKVGIFHPKKPSDVIVNATFVARPGPVPPLLVQLQQDAKRTAKQLGGFSDIIEARAHFAEGLINEMRGDNDAALAWFLKAVESLEADRRALRDERSRGTFLEDRIGFYYAAIQQLLDRGRHAEAFELLERSRSRTLADLLANRKLAFDRPIEQKLYAESAVLRTQIADAQGELFELASAPDAAANASQIGVLQRQIRALQAEDQKVVTRMAVEAPRLQNLVTSAPVDLKAVQQSMREEGYEILQYLVLEYGVLVWHIAPDTVTVRNVFLPRTEVMEKVAALQNSLADRNRDFDEMVAREMFLYLIQPVLSGIRSERLVIIPHEDLHYVPFQVFQDPGDGRYLGERFQITYAPSVSVLLGLRRSPGLSGGRLLAVADPGIEEANPEVRAIAKLFPGESKVVTDTLARESDVKAWSRDFDVIHLAVHGKFAAAEPMLSHLSLAAGGGDDGRLTAVEMFGLPLDKTRLVVLSACETGRAEATHGNEIFGMVRALMYAGAGTLVLSRWKVDSAATALWMQTFYQAATSSTMPEAARAALIKVKSNPEYRNPYYWAAFTMTGR
jgi:CHAT domain-containing protein